MFLVLPTQILCRDGQVLLPLFSSRLIRQSLSNGGGNSRRLVVFDKQTKVILTDNLLYLCKMRGYNGHTGLDEVEITEPKCGKETFPTQSSGVTIIVDGIPTEEKTTQTTAETTKPELKNEDMITLAESYKKAGYSIMIKDPSNEHQQCYGAIEHFRAYNNTKFYDVFLYENAEAAENAQYMMYGEGPDRLNGATPDTQIVNERILIAEYN